MQDIIISIGLNIVITEVLFLLKYSSSFFMQCWKMNSLPIKYMDDCMAQNERLPKPVLVNSIIFTYTLEHERINTKHDGPWKMYLQLREC